MLASGAEMLLPGVIPAEHRLGQTPASSAANGSLEPYIPDATKPWNALRAGHLLRRTGFGLSWDRLQAALVSNPAALVDSMLQSAQQPSPPGSWVTQQPFPQLDQAAISQYYVWVRDMQEWWFNLMMKPETMLRENMTLFWHNHFVSEFLTVYVTQWMYNQNQLYRTYAFGDFRELTKRVTVDTAMLMYLNGAQNNSGNPNENYARELLELFTLGVGAYTNGTSHYTENDIIQLARALTGWTVNGLASEFKPPRFDNTAKTIFGNTANYGIEGKTPFNVIDHIFDQTDTDVNQKRAAVFICSKLYQFFVHHEPDMEIVAGMAMTLESNNWQIGPVLRQLLLSEHFFDENIIGAQIKSPAEFVLGSMQELKLTPTMNRSNTSVTRPETHDPLTTMNSLSQLLFYPPNVKGWIGGRTWLSSATVPLRIRYSKLWIEPQSGSLPYGFDPVAFVKALPGNDDVDNVLDHLLELLLPVQITSAARDLLRDELLGGGPAYEWGPDKPNAPSRIRACLIRIANLGEYQLT
jgi:uncharacterized protein (DUF1800 family)